MKAQEYYQYLVETSGVAIYRRPPNGDQFPEGLFAEAGFSTAEMDLVRSAGREMNEDPSVRGPGWLNLVLREIFSLLPDEQQRQMRDIVFAGEFPTGDYNALIAKVPDEKRYVILMNVGLLALLHDVAKVIVFSEWPKGGNGSAELPTGTSPSGESLDKEGREYFRDVIRNYVEFENYVRPPRRFAPSGKTNLVADLLAWAAYRFVLAHEIAHVVLGHLDHAEAGVITVRGSEVKIPVLNKPMKEELYADTLGGQILMAALFKNWKSRSLEGPMWYTGPFFFLALAEIVDRVLSVESATHPPGKIRCMVLEEFMKKTLPKELFDTCNSVSGKILQQLQSVAECSGM